jgi:aspartyl-tRNA(Asn)/glutamyl-tRNA(Gln) amidotransferase subunit A
MQELSFAPIAELHQRFLAREVSPVEVCEATLARLEEWEPRLNAVITTCAESARGQAHRAETAFARGEPTSPLTGVPVSVKDVIAMAGAPMTAGSRILTEHYPEHDAAVVGKLREAGAVIFAKTNLLEFAYGFVHPDYGQSHNPWNLDRTTGGSSSGSAALTTAGIGYASIGTDTGGSIRLPAAFCGLTGLRPTFGAISCDGVLPLAPSLDTIGVLTHTTADNQAMLAALTNPPAGPARPVSRPLRIGVVTDLLGDPCTAEVRVVFDTALEALADASADAREVHLSGVRELAEHGAVLMLAEAAQSHRTWYPARAADYAPGTAANLEAGTKTPAIDYLYACDQRERFTGVVDALFEKVDVLACPTIGFTAPEREPDFEGGGLDYILRTLPFAATGHPALSILAGLAATEHLPVGLQLIAPPSGEELLYRAAQVYETHIGGHPQPAI